MQLRNKICLVTGSAVRVGQSIAITLAQKGAKIAIHYNNHKNDAIQTKKQIEKYGNEAITVQADISKKEEWLKMRDILLKKWGRIDVLVNNAAIFYKTELSRITENDWQRFLEINLLGTFWGCQIFGQQMTAQQSGKIVNIADVSAYHVWPTYIPYCVSKAGVIALTKGIAKSLAPYVTVNAVSPGTVLLAEEYDEEEEENLIKKTPLQRVGDPQDIANTVVFLLEGSDFITGTTIDVDGGRSIN